MQPAYPSTKKPRPTCGTRDQEDTQRIICQRVNAPFNPRLCQHCQGWDDLTHITFCVGDELPELELSTFEMPELQPSANPYGTNHVPADASLLKFRPWEALEQARDCLVCNALVVSLRKCYPGRKPVSIAMWRFWPEDWHSPSSEERQERQDRQEPDTDQPWVGKCLLTFCVAWPQEHEEDKTTIEHCLVEMIVSYRSWGYDLDHIQLWDRDFLNTEIIKSWLSYCENHHGEMCDTTMFNPGLPPGFRVIDVVEKAIIEPSGPLDNYVALSYQWSTATSDPARDLMLLRQNMVEVQTPGALSSDRLPEVIQDAMQLCRDIGQRYLWVDRLCIFQDQEDKHGWRQVQIDAMDAIYWLATVTIVACADGVGVGLPGVSSRPRPFTLRNQCWGLSMDGTHCIHYFQPIPDDIINPSSWNTRGWTFQERWLSRRHIFFGQRHAYLTCFYCKECETSLEMDNVIRAKTENKHGSFASGVRVAKASEGDRFWDPLAQYLGAVEEYTARSLGQSIDILNAFTGVNKFFLERLQTPSLHGLPAKYLFRSLLWARRGSPPVNIQGHVPDSIPSWSWAAGLGSVWWDWWTTNSYTKVGNLVRFWYSDGEAVMEVVEATSWFDKYHTTVRVESDPETINKKFQERYQHHPTWYRLPASSLWDHCTHSPQEAICHYEISEEAIRVASTRRGCLAFNTTMAHLSLRANLAVESSTKWKIIDIIDENGNAIGNVIPEIRPGNDMLSSIGCSTSKFHAIVLGACARGKDIHGGEDWEPKFKHEGREVYRAPGACGLYVMIVEKNGIFSSRLGIGVVCPLGWTSVQPTWETIFLV